MIAVACHQRRLAVGHKGNMARSRLRISEIDFARRGQRLVGDGEDRDGAVVTVGDERHSAGRIDREAGRCRARLNGRDNSRRLGLQVDDRNPIIGCGLFRIGRVYLDGASDKRETFVAGNRHTLRRADDAGRCFDFADHFRRFDVHVDDRHGVGGRIVRHHIGAVDQDGLVVVRGHGDLRGSSNCKQRQCSQREGKLRRQPMMAFHDVSPARFSLCKTASRAEPANGRQQY